MGQSHNRALYKCLIILLSDVGSVSQSIVRHIGGANWRNAALKSNRFYPNLTTLRSGLYYCKSVCRLSVCLSVCLARSCALLRGLKLSALFLHRCVLWPSSDTHAKFYGDRPREPLHRRR